MNFKHLYVGCGGSVVGSVPCIWKVHVGSLDKSFAHSWTLF